MLDKIVARLTRMIRMDHSVYDEIAVDENATMEAAVIVLVVAVLSAIGSLFFGNFGSFVGTLLLVILVSWLLWSAIVWVVGTRLFTGSGTFWNVARVLGYVMAPMVLGIIPVFGGLIGGILSLVLAFFAIREVMDLTTEKTVLTIIIGWVISVILGWVF